MDSPNDQYNQQLKKNNKKPDYYSLYFITHLIISFFAIYLSWQCNKEFNFGAFILALFCPYFYIIWALATSGGCGIFNGTVVEHTNYFTTPVIKN
jgi:hypothetical protein